VISVDELVRGFQPAANRIDASGAGARPVYLDGQASSPGHRGDPGIEYTRVRVAFQMSGGVGLVIEAKHCLEFGGVEARQETSG
jgi:hypothetical protein